MNEKIDVIKLPFCTGGRNDVVKKSLFCHKEMLVWNGDFL